MEQPAPGGLGGWLMPKPLCSPRTSCLRAGGAAAAADPAPSPGKRSRPSSPGLFTARLPSPPPFQPDFSFFFVFGKGCSGRALAQLRAPVTLRAAGKTLLGDPGRAWCQQVTRPSGGLKSAFKGPHARPEGETMSPSRGESQLAQVFFLLPPINSWEHLYWPGPALPASTV